MIKIKVPATTANMGPGYDVLGAALELYASFTAEPSENYVINGCPEEFRNEDNLVIDAYKRTAKAYGKDIRPIRLSIDTEVPIARGLGSSSTCIVAGILIADILYSLGLSKDEQVQLATGIEGHPDNVAPAVYGGVVGGLSEDGKVSSIRFMPDPDWRFIALIPDHEVRTEDARRVVKQEIPLQTAVHSISHVLGLVRALETGDEELYGRACRDLLHEPYRKALIPDYEKAKSLSKELGAAAFFISGSGSTMMAVTKKGEKEELLKRAYEGSFPGSIVKSLGICHDGASVKLS